MRTLETERLILRDWKESDIGNCAVYSDDVIRYLLTSKNNYAVILKETDEVIGSIGLNEDGDNNPKCRNIGFRLLEQFQNQGFMSEALTAVISTAKEIIPCLSYVHKTSDLRSKHIAQKFGFKYTKTFKDIRRNPSDEEADFMYCILDLQ